MPTIHRTRVLAAALIAVLALTACPPPTPPPSAANWSTGQMVHEARDTQGNVLCRAIAQVGVFLREGAPTEVRFISDVRVSGPGAPDAPCIYRAWAFGLTVACEDGSQFGCGAWRLDTPDGTVSAAVRDSLFRHVPEGGKLTVTFTATWGFSANHQGSIASPVIHCDTARCKFYP